MVDLQFSCGLPIKFDDITEKFQYGEGVVFSALNHIPLKSMLPGLLNKSLRYPENVYLEHRNICNRDDQPLLVQNNLNYDVVMLPSGLMGVEFIRTHIFFGTGGEGRLSEIVEAISGTLTVLLKRNEQKGEYYFETAVSEGLVVRLKPGEKFAVPKGYYYTFVNTKEHPVVFSRFYTKGCQCDYSTFQREQGLAYYAIRKNARTEIVFNPRYRDIPEVKRAWGRDLSLAKDVTIEINNDQPLYKQAISSAPAFSAVL